MASLNLSSITKVQTSNYASRIKYENLKSCCFNGLIKSFSDDPRTRASWSVDRSLAGFWFRKVVTKRDSDYEK